MRIKRRVVVFALCAVVFVVPGQAATWDVISDGSEPWASVEYEVSVGDFDSGRPGDELKLSYLVTNLGTAPSALIHQFQADSTGQVSAGVYAYSAPSGWDMHPNGLSFRTPSSSFIGAGEQGLFEVYATIVTTYERTWYVRSITGPSSVGGWASVPGPPLYEATTSYIGQNGDGSYRFGTLIRNVCPFQSANYSVTEVRLLAAQTSGHFFTGDVGDFWNLESVNDEEFVGVIWLGEGAIDPPLLDPTADELVIFYDSPFRTLKPSLLYLLTDGEGFFRIPVLVPGIIPEPATLSLLALGSLVVLRRRKR